MQHLLPWLSLKSVPGIGNLLYNRLIARFKSPEAVFSASPASLCRIQGICENTARNIKRHKPPAWLQREIETVYKQGYHIVTLQDDAYPRLLRDIPDPPPILYVYGHLQGCSVNIAVVGSRKATTYGLTTTHRLCEGLAAHGITVVSGMARGIDTAAHAGALSGKGRTTAVLGTGMLHIYPRENLKLCRSIAENGAVITEFPMHAKPEPHHFPMRNRIISGMSLGTVVIEATERSGSLITARLAAEQGREVFAVPGSINAATTRGPHSLIQQGAKLVNGINDILEEIAAHVTVCTPAAARRRHRDDRPDGGHLPPDLSDEEKQVLEVVGDYSVHADDMIGRLGMEMRKLNAVLTQLELKGLILREPGNTFVRHGNSFKE